MVVLVVLFVIVLFFIGTFFDKEISNYISSKIKMKEEEQKHRHEIEKIKAQTKE